MDARRAVTSPARGELGRGSRYLHMCILGPPPQINRKKEKKGKKPQDCVGERSSPPTPCGSEYVSASPQIPRSTSFLWSVRYFISLKKKNDSSCCLSRSWHHLEMFLQMRGSSPSPLQIWKSRLQIFPEINGVYAFCFFFLSGGLF